eukprot:jgi/Psemu1/53918/gm1.53918_g
MPSYAPSVLPSGSPSAVPSAAPSEDPSEVPSLFPTGVPSDRPSSEPSGAPSSLPSGSPSGSPSSEPSTLPSEPPSSALSMAPSSAIQTSFTFPKFNFEVSGGHQGFLHGLCVMGASSASVSVSLPNDNNFGYDAFPGFKDDEVKFWTGDPHYYYGITGNGPSLCEGGIAFQPNMSYYNDNIPQGSEPTLTARHNNDYTLTFCAYVEDDPSRTQMDRDGGWPSILENQGFTKTGSFSAKYGQAGPFYLNIMHMYCKEIANSSRRNLRIDFSFASRDMQDATMAEEDSPFVTTIGLSTEGAEELMTAPSYMTTHERGSLLVGAAGEFNDFRKDVAIAQCSSRSTQITPAKQTLGNFTRCKLCHLDNWSKWRDAEQKQLDQFLELGMYGTLTHLPKGAISLPPLGIWYPQIR